MRGGYLMMNLLKIDFNLHLFTNRQVLHYLFKVNFPIRKLRPHRKNTFFLQITANTPYRKLATTRHAVYHE